MNIKVNSLSLSTVNAFTVYCPEKLWMDKILKLPGYGVSVNLVAGIAYHKAYETMNHMIKANKSVNADILYRVFESTFEMFTTKRIIYGKQDRDTIYNTAKELIGIMAGQKQSNKIVSIEPKLTAVVDGLKVIISPDLVTRDRTGKLIIEDIKSSAKAYTDEDIRKVTEQVKLYSFGFDEPVRGKLKLLIKRKKTPEIMDIDLNIEDISKDELMQRFFMVKKALEAGIHYRNRSYNCRVCEYKHICNADDSKKISESINSEVKKLDKDIKIAA